jgi:hypothetical protein
MINNFSEKLSLYDFLRNFLIFFNDAKKDVPIILFSFFSLFCFFPVLEIKGHEIFPYYVICIFFINLNLYSKMTTVIYAIPLVLLFIVFVALNNSYALTLLEILIPFYTLISFNKLTEDRKILFAKALLLFSFLIFLLIAYQFFFPKSIDYIYEYFLVRKYSYLNLHGRVIGIAPEPAYMASWLLGALILISIYLKGIKNFLYVFTLPFFLAIGSISGIGFLFIMLLVENIKKFSYLIFIIFIFILLIFVGNDYVANRLLDAYKNFDINLGILNLFKIDSALGSYRLQTLIEPLSSFNFATNNLSKSFEIKGYSIFSNLYYICSPLHIISLLFLLKFRKNSFWLISFLAFLAYGPMLNWLLYSGFIGFSSKRERETNKQC